MKIERPKCFFCGRFVGETNLAQTEFIPDSEVSIEEINFCCKSCKDNGRSLQIR